MSLYWIGVGPNPMTGIPARRAVFRYKDTEVDIQGGKHSHEDGDEIPIKLPKPTESPGPLSKH